MTYWPGINEWLFSFKTFAAAMLALYIAFAIGLDRPVLGDDNRLHHRPATYSYDAFEGGLSPDRQACRGVRYSE